MMELGSKETFGELFDQAIKMENEAASIYTEFSRLFSHIPEISAFWQGMVDDEILHAKTLEDIRKSLTRQQLLSPADKDMWENVARIQRMLSKDFIGSIETLNDAYELAHNLEFSEVNAIFEFLASEFIPSQKRKEFIILQITQHLQKLSDFRRYFGGRDRRKGITIRRV